MNGASMPVLDGDAGETPPVYEEDLPVILDEFRNMALFYGAFAVIVFLPQTLFTFYVWLKPLFIR